IVDHLQAMLDHAQPVVGFAEQPRLVRGDHAVGGERVERVAGAAAAQRRTAAAVDQLLGLGEELDLADAAAAALEIEAGARLDRAAIGPADPPGEPADLLERGEVEAAAPDERA